MRRTLPVLIGTTLVILISFFFLHFKNVSAATATHVVISEVQTAGVAAGDDFIELYNPTNTSINLKGMRLVKRAAAAITDSPIVSITTDSFIPAHGFYLWCNSVNLNATLNCDKTTTATIASNNSSIALRNGPANTGAIIDAVAFGTVSNNITEGTTLTAPAASTSVERKANSSSNATTMGVGGTDEFAGNGEDTDNNASDFVGRATPQPQNSQSSVEPVPATPTPTPTETPTPTLEPSATPTDSPTPTPTLEPTATPSPTIEPSATPTESPTPTPTTAPTETPTMTPSPTLSPTPSMSPTPTPTPGGDQVIVNTPHLVCTLTFKIIPFFNFHLSLPVVKCMKI